MASSSAKKRRLLSTAACYAIDALEKRQLLCALHSGGDESIGTFPAAESSVDETASQSLSTGPLETSPLSALPQLHSRVTATRKIFLDFDGANIPTWGTNNAMVPPAPYTPGAIPAYTADSDATTYSDTELSYITQVWQNVAEKFSPFDVDVTTVDPGNRTDGLTMACVIGGTNSWYGSGGGVAYVNSFTSVRDNTCFVWSQGSGTNINFMGAGAAHELGHAFGLEHQGVTTNGVVTTEYWNGSGQIVPIMGNANNVPSRRGIWYNGQANNRDNAANSLQPLGTQNDLTIIGDGHNNFGFRPDDAVPASVGGAPSLATDNQGHYTGAGVIESQFDADGWRFYAQSAVGSFTITNAGQGGMLSPRVELVTSPGNVAVSASTVVSADGNSVTVSTTNLTIGQNYALNVHGDFTYGSVGQYTIVGTLQTFAYLQGGVLYVNGFNGVNDDIQFDLYTGLNPIKLYVDDAINGNPSQVTALLFNWSDVDSIVITTGTGNDTVRMLRSLPLAETTLDMGDGYDTLDVRGYDYGETFTISSTVVDWGYQPITLNSTVDNLIVRGFQGDDVFYLNSWDNPGIVQMYGGTENDTVNYGDGIVEGSGGNAYFYGEAGTDSININNTANAVGRSFSVGTNTFSTNTAREFSHNTVENVRVNAGSGPDNITVYGVPAGTAVTVTGNLGDDSIRVGVDDDGQGGAAYSYYILGNVTVNGSGGDDTLTVNDQPYLGASSYQITSNTIRNATSGSGYTTFNSDLEHVDFHARFGGATTTVNAYTGVAQLRIFWWWRRGD